MTEPQGGMLSESSEPGKKLDDKEVHLWDRLLFILKEGAETTTAHGLPNIARTQNRLVQLIWALCFLGSSAYCVYTIVLSIQDYLTYPVGSSVNIVNELPTEFPTILFCNMNPIYSDAPEILAFANQVLNLPDFYIPDNLTATEYSRYITESMKMIAFRYKIDLKPYMYWAPIDRMLVSCTFGGAVCNSSDFEEVYVYDYGYCFRFNPNGERLTSRRGFDNGLQLELYIGNGGSRDDFKYLPSRGIRYMITNRTLGNTNIFELGYDAAPGQVTNVEIKKKHYNKLGPPYSDCLSDLSPQSSGQTDLMRAMFQELKEKKYNQIKCQDLCFNTEIIKKCNCYTWRYPVTNKSIADYNLDPDNERCVPAKTFPCMIDLVRTLTINPGYCQEQCPVECEWYDYETVVSTSDYMSHWYWDYQQNYTSQHASGDSEQGKLFYKISQGTFDVARNSSVKLMLYLNQLGYTSTTESALYSTSSLLATIGGNLGLFIGISFLSIMEVFEVAFRLIECLVFQAYAKRKAIRKIRDDRTPTTT